MAKRAAITVYMAQCKNIPLDGRFVGQNLNLIPYANEKAAQDHLDHHIAEKACTREHLVRTVTA